MKMNKVNHSYQSYSCADGVASINIYNGNLLFEYPLVSTGMNSFEISTSLVYNSDYQSTDFNGRLIGMGNGWKLNIEQHVFKYESSFNFEGFTEDDYVYVDSNWNIHKFVKYYPNDDTTYPMHYYDESGTGLRLKISSSNIPYEIVDCNNNKLFFNSNGLIVKMVSAINAGIIKNITYDNLGNITSIYDNRNNARKIEFTYINKLLINCFVLNKIQNYKIDYKNNQLIKISRYATNGVDNNENLISNDLTSFVYNVNNLIIQVLDLNTLNGLEINYNNALKVNKVLEGAFSINYDFDYKESNAYLGEDYYLETNEIDEQTFDSLNYITNDEYILKKHLYVIESENIQNFIEFEYFVGKTIIINKYGIKINNYFNKEESLISTLEEKDNILYTLNKQEGWKIYPLHENSLMNSINKENVRILDSDNNFTLNMSYTDFLLFYEENQNEDETYPEYLNLSFWISTNNNEILKNYINYNYSAINSDNEVTLYSTDSVVIEKTNSSSWQFVTLPIKILNQYGKLGDIQITLPNQSNNATFNITNIRLNKGNSLQTYMYNNEPLYKETIINFDKTIDLDGTCYSISENFYITNNDLFNTYKNIYLKQQNNESTFDFVYNNGKNVKKVSNAKLLVDTEEYQFNVIEGVPNYYTKSIIPIKHNDIEENTKLIWSIVENQGVFNYDSSKLKHFYELKTLYGATANIVESTGRLNIDNSYIIYYQTYFNGIPKLEKNFNGVVKKYYFDDYGNIFMEQIYNENDLSENILIDYSYDDYTHYVQSLRETPISITQNNITTYLNYDSINQQLDSYNNTLQEVLYDYDVFKNKIYKITFSETLNNTEVGYNEIKYIPNSNVNALCSKDNIKFEFLYDKFGNVQSIKNNGKEILDYNYQENEIENIYTIVRASGDGSTVNEIAKYDKYGKIKEYSINEDEEQKVTYEYEEKNISDYLKRLVKINDGFSNETHNIIYTDNVKIPYYTETIENKQYVKKSNNLLEYKLGSDNESYLYNFNIIPFPNSKLTSTYVERINDVDKNIESFSFLYENDSLNRPNRKVRSYKLCSTCKSSSCNCGEEANIIDNIVVDRQISYYDNSILPQKITYNVEAKDEGINAFNTNNYFYYINTYSGRNISKLENNGIYFTRNPYNDARSLDFVLNNNIYNYQYDEFNRLVREDHSISLDYRNENIENKNYENVYEYEYDENSNMLSKKKINDNEIVFTNLNGRLTKIDNNGIITNVNYDDFGNMLNDHNHTYEYNNRGLLSKCIYKKDASTSYVSYYNYDYRGNRYQKKGYINSYKLYTINYYYDNDTLLGEDWVDENNDVRYKFRYFYDLEGITGFNYWSSSDNGYNNKGYNYNYIKDSLGNINKIMYEGETIGEYIYDAWGNSEFLEYVSINDDSLKRERDFFVLNYNPFRYKGYYYDVETNLFLVTSRYYSPELGRFIQPADVSSLNPTSINGLNLYSYANNNPISIAYKSSNMCGRSSGALVSSLSLGGKFTQSNNGFGGNVQNDWINLKPVPSWVETAIDVADVGFSASIVGLTAWYTLKYPGVADLMKLDGIASIPGKYADFVEGLGYAFVFVETGIDVYNNWQQGQSAGYILASGAYTFGTGMAITWGSAKIGAYIGTSIGGPVGFVVGGVAGILIGLGLEWLSDEIKEWIF